MRLFPRSLIGQIATLIAVALFVAQAISFALLVNERRQLRFEQATRPSVVRIVDAAERLAGGRTLGGGRPDGGRRRGRVDLVAANPIDPRLTRAPDVEAALDAALSDAGVRHGRIVTGIRTPPAMTERIGGTTRRRPPGYARRNGELLIAVEQPGRGWLSLSAAWPRETYAIVLRLIGQTLILYGIVLLPVLWLGRRIARPLRELEVAATGFGRGDHAAALPETGPDDVRSLVAAFNALRLRVGAMLDEKDRMLGAIGHDLRTPLAALRVRIESVDDEHDRTRMADTIDEMSRTLDDILSLARLGRPSEAATEVDLAALVDAVVDDFRDLGASVAFADSPRIVRRIRPNLMRRAVRNLIENAVKYGGGADVSLSQDRGNISVCVADSGPGIPVDHLENAFDPFTRLEGSRNRNTGGIGLGLALARAIVREAGGEIVLANRPEGGLLARIVLPNP